MNDFKFSIFNKWNFKLESKICYIKFLLDLYRFRFI